MKRNSVIRLSSALLVAASLLVVAPALSGCSIIEGVVENATGGDVELPGTEKPADFPTEVPLIEGDVVTGGKVSTDSGTLWNVTVKVSGPDSFTEAAQLLTDAGFVAAEGVGGQTDEGGAGSFAKDPYGVQLLVLKGGDGWVANYSVTQGK